MKLSFFAAALLVAVFAFFSEIKPVSVYADTYPVSASDRIASSLKKKTTKNNSKSKNLVKLSKVRENGQQIVWKTNGKPIKSQTEPVDESMWNEFYSVSDLRLMSSIIYCEAGSMSEDARIAVANVIINRVNSKTDWKHVNTIKEVIYDDKWGVQFTPILGSPSLIDQAMEIYDNLADYEGNWKYRQMQNCISSAKKAFCGEIVIPDSYMYFNGSIESSKAKCEEKGRSYIIIDHHIYFE